MKIKVELMGGLVDYYPESNNGIFDFTLTEKSTIQDLLNKLAIKRKVNVAVNGDEETGFEFILSEGDEVTLFSVISGG